MITPRFVDFPPDCEAVVRSLWDYVDGEVGADDLAEIDAHLELCQHCRDHVDFERRLVDELLVLRGEHSNPEGLRQRVIETLRSAGFGGDGSGAAPKKRNGEEGS